MEKGANCTGLSRSVWDSEIKGFRFWDLKIWGFGGVFNDLDQWGACKPGFGKNVFRFLYFNLSEGLDLVIIISQADYLSHFHMVVFVYCRDLRGRSIQDYVADTYPPFLQVRIKSEIFW